MTSKTWIIISAVAALLFACWWSVTRVIIPMQLSSSEETATVPLDYSVPGHWLYRPDSPPPPVWEAGWEIDFFVIPPAPQRLSAEGLIDPMDDQLRDDQRGASAALVEILGSAGQVYMPSLRWPSPISKPPADVRTASADVLTSFETYLERDNQGRAVVFVVPANAPSVLTTVSEAVSNRLAEIQRRLGGLVVIGRSATDVSAWSTPLCSAALATNCTFVVPAEPASTLLAPLLTPKPTLIPNLVLNDPEATKEALNLHTRVILADLENNVAKTAEPLGELTFVDAPEIRRPGEVDEAQPDQN